MLFYQADPNVIQIHNTKYSTPLHKAIKRKNQEIVKLLISFGASAEIDFKKNGISTTVIDLCQGDPELLSALKAEPFLIDQSSFNFPNKVQRQDVPLVVNIG